MPVRLLHAQTILALLQSRGFRASLNRMADGTVFVSGELGSRRLGFAIGGPDPAKAAATEAEDRSVLAIDGASPLDTTRVLDHIGRQPQRPPAGEATPAPVHRA